MDLWFHVVNYINEVGVFNIYSIHDTHPCTYPSQIDNYITQFCYEYVCVVSLLQIVFHEFPWILPL